LIRGWEPVFGQDHAQTENLARDYRSACPYFADLPPAFGQEAVLAFLA
jgi:hypothetical protein